MHVNPVKIPSFSIALDTNNYEVADITFWDKDNGWIPAQLTAPDFKRTSLRGFAKRKSCVNSIVGLEL